MQNKKNTDKELDEIKEMLKKIISMIVEYDETTNKKK